MGVENSNQMQYGVNEAMAELLAIAPNTTRVQQNQWRTLGTQAILDEIARITNENAAKAVAVTPDVVDVEAEEVVAEKSGKSKKNA